MTSTSLKTNGIERIFKVNKQPVSWSPKQREIAETILFNLHYRNQIIAPTQYGKSMTVAQATLLRVTSFDERFTILAPSEKKAGIIMGYLIDHCFDDRMFAERLELDKSENLDRLRRERSRNNLTFKGGGGVMTLTLDARNGKRSIEAAMGFGGNRLILDESSLIDDPLYATVKRMLGGYPTSDQFLLEIGNPFYRNHFYRTWKSDRYNTLFIDYHVGLAEGRYSPEFIEEMREEAFFDIFYECRFPDEDFIDERGYRALITNDELDEAFTEAIPDTSQNLKLGVDVGGGGDYNVYVLRNADMAWVESRNRSNDTMSNVTEVERILKDYPTLQPEEVYIDDIGIGRGVSDRLREKGYAVNGVSVGEKALDQTKYKNIKAENYWNIRLWLKAKGKLEKEQGFRQLTWIKYKVSTDKVVQIEPKEDLKKRTGKSPDWAEALMLTFTEKAQPAVRIL
jgi:hypothetical protein